MNTLGSYLIAREQIARDQRRAGQDLRDLHARPDAAPLPAHDTGAGQIRRGWLERILKGRVPVPARAR